MKKEKIATLPWHMVPTIVALAGPTMLEQLMQTAVQYIDTAMVGTLGTYATAAVGSTSTVNWLIGSTISALGIGFLSFVAAVQYIDTAMVGTLGTYATAAVGSTSTVNWLIGSTISALGIGFLSFVARACGAGDRERAGKAASQAVLAVLIVGIFFTVLTLGLSGYVPGWMQVSPEIQPLASQYFFILYSPMLARTAILIFGTLLRSAGDSKTPMQVGLLVNLINVVLNFLLIYPAIHLGPITIPGAGMGVIGAALASAVAFAVGGICITVALWHHPVISPKGQALRPDWSVLKPCLRVALPNAAQRFCTSLGFVAFASMINSIGDVATAAHTIANTVESAFYIPGFGMQTAAATLSGNALGAFASMINSIGDVATAAHTIANTVESAFYIPGFGMQTAAATLSGNALGARDKRKIKDLGKMILILETGLMIVSGSLLFLFAPNMMTLFSKDPEVIALGATVLRMVAISEPFYGVAIILEGVMQGVGKTLMPFVFGVSGMWGIRILGTYVCTQMLGFGLVAAWGCMIAHNMLLFVLFSIYYASGRWNPLEEQKSRKKLENTT